MSNYHILVGRCLVEELKAPDINISDPISANGRGNITKKGGLESLLGSAVSHPGGSQKAILVVLDADEKPCPAQFGKDLARRARATGMSYPVGIVVANRSYEAWLIASIAEIARQEGFKLTKGIRPPEYPEQETNPKGWIERQMGPGRPYLPIVHQGKMTTYMNFRCAETKCRSFRHFLTTLDDIVKAAANPPRKGYVIPRPC